MKRARDWSLCSLLLLLSPTASTDSLPMWELTGATNRVALLGSIHFLRPGQNSLDPAIIRAYEQADVLLMELDMDDLDPLAAQTTMQRLGVDPRGRTLDEILGEADFRVAEAKSRQLGIDLALLRGLEPWLAALTITQLQLAVLGFDAQSGVEQQLVRLARRDRKEILGLETLEEQLAAMDGLAPTAQREFLMQTLDEAAGMSERIDEIVTAWQSGDTRTLESEFLDELRGQPDIYRRIVVERNRAWAARIAGLLRERNDYLVVVGTLHLVGPDSLIRMLGEAGHQARKLGRDPAREIAVD